MAIEWKLDTNKGGREHNEDYVGMKQKGNHYCFVLADGLGGHGKGEVASQLVVESILASFEHNLNSENFLHEALVKAQNELLDRQIKENCVEGMKTTIVVLQIVDSKLRWAYCGDSRLYLFQKKKLKLHSLDHSVPQMLVYTKEIKEKDIRFHEDRNRLLRVMGVDSQKELFEISPWMDKKDNMQFLMCSDGFWELIIEKEMEKSLKKSKSVSEWLDEMIALVATRGVNKDSDNYSAISIWM